MIVLAAIGMLFALRQAIPRACAARRSRESVTCEVSAQESGDLNSGRRELAYFDPGTTTARARYSLLGAQRAWGRAPTESCSCGR